MILRFCICIPTYDNPATIESVVRDCLEATPYPILVVDDGSRVPVRLGFRDERVSVIRHDVNRGKGVALQTGLRECLRRGFTHVITVDGDGQHLASEIPRLVAASLESPWDLVIGARRMACENVPGVSRFGREFSNYWVRFQTDQRISDSQSGFRVYPLFHVQNLSFFTRRFDFEIEILIRLLWRGVRLRELEIDCFYPPRGERVSHFDKLWDNVRISCLNTVLVGLSLMRSHRSPREIALAVGAGVLIGCTPFFGLHTLIAALAAFAFRLNAVYLWLGTQISIPPIAPLLALVSVSVGSRLTGVPATEGAVSFSLNWLLGSLGVGAALGLVAGALAFVASRRFQGGGRRREAAWNGRTRGGRFGNGFVRVMTRLGGLRAGQWLLLFIVPYFYLFAPRGRRASDEYWSLLRPELSWLARQWRVLRHFHRFAQVLLDRVYQGFRTEPFFRIRSNGMENILGPVEGGKGLLMVSAHVGGWDLAAAALKTDGLGGEFHMLQYQARGMDFERAQKQDSPEHVRKVLSNQTGQSLLQVRELLAQGRPVGLMGDRPLGSQYELVSLLGRLAPLDCTAFRVAAACQAPLLFTFGFRGTDGAYEFHATPARLYRFEPGVDRMLQTQAWAQEFAEVLEGFIRRYPDQWFNFFPFWSTEPAPPEGVEAGTARNHSKESLRKPARAGAALEAAPRPSVETAFQP